MGTIVTSSKPFIEFENHHKKIRIPYVIYADFETGLEAVDEQNVVSGKTTKDVEHVSSSFAIYIKSIYKDDIPEPLYLDRGPNADREFNKVITIVAKNIYWLLPKNKKMIFTKIEERKYNKANMCYICAKEFTEKNYKVRDHDHYTGKYRGAACNKCNMNFHAKRFIPVFCHNISGYDSHLFWKTIGYEEGRLSCIPENEERFITLSKRILVDKVDKKYVSIELRFLDSYKFMSSSLNKLASYLPKELFIETKKYFTDDVF